MRCVYCLHNEPMLPYHRCSLKLLNNVGNSDWVHFMIKCSNFAGGTSLDLSSFSSQRIWNGFFESKLHIMLKSVSLMQWLNNISSYYTHEIWDWNIAVLPTAHATPISWTWQILPYSVRWTQNVAGVVWSDSYCPPNQFRSPPSPTLHLLLTRPLACHKTRPWKQWSPSWNSSRPQ